MGKTRSPREAPAQVSHPVDLTDGCILMADFAAISPTALTRLIGTPDAPTLLDVCIDADFNLDPFVIPTARRCPHDSIDDIAPALTGQRVVVICQRGRKLLKNRQFLCVEPHFSQCPSTSATDSGVAKKWP